VVFDQRRRDWQSLRLNLPIVPIHDLTFASGDIVLATHGRGFYVMDDISTLEQMTDAVVAKASHLFKPRDQYRYRGGGGGGGGGGRGGRWRAGGGHAGNAPARPSGQNPPTGVVIQYWLKNGGENVGLEFQDATGKVIRTYSSKVDSAAAQPAQPDRRRGFFAPPPAPRAGESQRGEHVPVEHALSRTRRASPA
jgi:hypothetical protein